MATATREQAYPEKLREREDRLVRQRRERVDEPVAVEGREGEARRPAPGPGGAGHPEPPRVGLALSGGGIRSATFSLGVLQALARERLIGRIDFLSTVSGGGYVGAFLGCLFQRWRALYTNADEPAPGEEATPAEAVRELLVSPHSWPCHWLRECGRYLIPNRGSDETVLLAAFLRNWLAVQVVLVVLLLAPLILFRLGAVLLENTVLPPLLVLLVAALLAFWLVPAGVAYWLAPPFAVLLTGLAAAAAGLAIPLLAGAAMAPRRGVALAVLAASIALTLVVGAYYRWRYPDLAERRRYLTAGLAVGLQATVLVLGLGFVDVLGGIAHRWLGSRPATLTVPGLFAALGAAAAFVQKIAPRLLAGATNARPRIPGQVVASAAAIAIVALEAALLSAALRRLDPPPALAAGLAATLVGSFLLGRTPSFLNLSTQSTLYAARLTRAYLGATNATRQRYHKALSDPVDGDDLEFRAYAPWTEGGPLHVVNVTLNETMSGETQVEFRDRKGLNVAFGPCGLSVGARHHAQFPEDEPAAAGPSTERPPRLVLERVSPPEPFQVFVPDRAHAEPFPLGRLIAVSGAAFTTGLGSRTSLGLSLLLGLANVRLGYWWDSGTGPREGRPGLRTAFARALPVQAHLLEEMLARFYGAAERLWYLSDGGHFENTAVYELVRRRLPFIIACDNGCDPGYAWEDVGSLVRKLRLDFGAQVRLLERDDIDAAVVDPALRAVIVPWSSFAAWDGKARGRGGYATLADVTYEGSDDRTTILFLKPALRGDETADVLTYWSRHTEFPQQSTLDQFFDEDQWESYRRLGDACGTAVFRTGLPGWTPASMAPLPPAPASTPADAARARSAASAEAPPTA